MKPTRRQFLFSAAAVALAMVRPKHVRGQAEHPKPRPGVTAARVLGSADLGDDKEAIEVFDQVRQIPQVVDGIRCYCGCADLPSHYSLLSCFEADGMARHCEVCRGEAKLAYTLHRQGRTLAEIRAAIDQQFA